MREIPYDERYKHPPIILMWCETGEHGWFRVNRRYDFHSEPTHSRIPRNCPDHAYLARGKSIEEAMRRSHLRREAELPGGTIPSSKVCTSCKRRKDKEEYGVRYQTTKTFGKRAYLRPECLNCETKRSKEYAERKRREDPEGYRERRRQMSERNNRRRRPPSPLLDSKPLGDWLRPRLNGHTPTGLSRAAGVDEKTMARIINGTSRMKLSLEQVEAVLIIVGGEHLITTLYPIENT